MISSQSDALFARRIYRLFGDATAAKDLLDGAKAKMSPMDTGDGYSCPGSNWGWVRPMISQSDALFARRICRLFGDATAAIDLLNGAKAKMSPMDTGDGYSCPGSNWGSSPCKGDALTTAPQEPRHLYRKTQFIKSFNFLQFVLQ
jgi:hypothetical protein